MKSPLWELAKTLSHLPSDTPITAGRLTDLVEQAAIDHDRNQEEP